MPMLQSARKEAVEEEHAPASALWLQSLAPCCCSSSQREPGPASCACAWLALSLAACRLAWLGWVAAAGTVPAA